MLVHKRSANISILSLIIIVEISIFCEPIVLLNLGISFSNSPTFTSSKWNILLLLYFWIARMLRWFLYFKMALKTGSLMFLVTELFELNFRILSFFTILEKELFKVSKSLLFHIQMWATSHFLSDLFSLWILTSQRAKVFQNLLLSITFFSSKFW